ncbi:MAG: 50S ribosomal protein L18, partial [Epsilonproteobacteria bacterium 4484_65]
DGRKLGLKVNQEDVKKVAAEMAKNLASKNIDTVVFDRNGYLYHGVVASFADALREAGIKF